MDGSLSLLGACVVVVTHIFPPLVGYAQATPLLGVLEGIDEAKSLVEAHRGLD